MTGVAALAFAATFTSCSKAGDLYDEEKVNEQKEQAIVNSYEKAFEAAFGKVGANVDWGFSSKNSSTRALTRAVGDYKDYRGDLKPVNVTFPSDAPASNFDPDLDGVKSYKEVADAANQGGGFGYGVCYIDENHTGKVHIWGEYGKRAKLYIKEGTYDFTNETFDLCADADLFLLSGAIVTLNNTAANTAKFDVYIAPGAKLIANGENGYRADVDAHVFNHGTIECTRFEVNGTSSLYNVGTLKVPAGDVYIANSTSRIVNDGTITAASTHVEGSGALQNNAEWTVTGNTVVNCNVGGWVNNGHWTTQNYHYTAGSNNVINNCFLKVTNEFNINMSSASSDNGFKIDSNGGVETVNFNGGKAGSDPNSKSGPYKVIMGHKSLFKVTGTATLDGGNKGWGFYGPADGEYAVFQAKNVVRAAGLENNQGAVTYGGNLYVSAETHFAQGNDGNPNNLFIYEEGGFSVNTNIYAAGFKAGKPSITISKTPCNPGFEGDDDSEHLYRVIAEDLTASQSGDFDFNDVVFDVVSYDQSTNKTTLRLQACGGTLPLMIGSTKGANGVEVHSLYGDNTPDANTGKYKMWNTIKGQNTHEPVDFTINGKYTTPEELFNLRIEVFKENDWMLLTANKGVAACKILVDDRFPIVPERTPIANEQGNFTTYVQGNWKDEDGFWWIQK